MTVVDDDDWSNVHEHLRLLEAKLKHELPAKASAFLAYAESTFRGAGFSLVHRVLRLD